MSFTIPVLGGMAALPVASLHHRQISAATDPVLPPAPAPTGGANPNRSDIGNLTTAGGSYGIDWGAALATTALILVAVAVEILG